MVRNIGRLPDRAVVSDYPTEAYDPDQDGFYTTVEWYREDGTVYMRSEVSRRVQRGQYERLVLSYMDDSGENLLHQEEWSLEYDINRKIVAKKVRS